MWPQRQRWDVCSHGPGKPSGLANEGGFAPRTFGGARPYPHLLWASGPQNCQRTKSPRHKPPHLGRFQGSPRKLIQPPGDGPTDCTDSPSRPRVLTPAINFSSATSTSSAFHPFLCLSSQTSGEVHALSQSTHPQPYRRGSGTVLASQMRKLSLPEVEPLAP